MALSKVISSAKFVENSAKPVQTDRKKLVIWINLTQISEPKSRQMAYNFTKLSKRCLAQIQKEDAKINLNEGNRIRSMAAKTQVSKNWNIFMYYRLIMGFIWLVFMQSSPQIFQKRQPTFTLHLLIKLFLPNLLLIFVLKT